MVDKTDVHFYPIIHHYPPLSTMICVDTVFGVYLSKHLSFYLFIMLDGSYNIIFILLTTKIEFNQKFGFVYIVIA
jgi:hypothetical protein